VRHHRIVHHAAPAGVRWRTQRQECAMPTTEQTQATWIHRVLGIDTSAAAPAKPALASMEAKLNAAIHAAPSERTSLMAAWEAASEQAAAGNQAAADKILANLAPRLDAALAKPASSDAAKFGVAEGLVAERRAELEKYFQQRIGTAKSKSASELAKLIPALAEVIEDPDALVAALRAQIAALFDQLQAELGKSVKAGSQDDIAEIISAWNDRLDTDARITALRESWADLEVTSDFEHVLASLVDDIVSELAPAA
jgi:hypothetical protein